MGTFEWVVRVDEELAQVARGAGALRCSLGMGLEALARVGGHHELGFSSVEAYALERCERSARWVQESRGLARRLSELPAVRGALMKGELSFSMSQELAKVARGEDETAWLAEARTHTVRQVRQMVKERVRRGCLNGAPAGDELATDAIASEELRTLTVTVDREDAWLFECARMIVRHVAGPMQEDTVEALLGEGTTALLGSMDCSALTLCDGTDGDVRQREWEATLAGWREEAEARCESHFCAGTPATTRSAATTDTTRAVTCDEGAVAIDAKLGFAFDGNATAIDAELRRVAAELATRGLRMGRLAETFWKADGWRRLGYATEAQYARERLGTGLSSLKAKRRLARLSLRMPRLAEALERGELGYEATRLVASIATPATVEAWVLRAKERTVIFLREEVDAAQMLERLGVRRPETARPETARPETARPETARPETARPETARFEAAPADATASGPMPPSDETMQKVAALQSCIVSGAVFRNAAKGAGSSRVATSRATSGSTRSPRATAPDASAAALAELFETLERGRDEQPGAHAQRARGRVTLRLRVSAGTRVYYRWLEELFMRHGTSAANGKRGSFLRFLCCSLVEAWKHTLGGAGAYAGTYERDRYRCTSPVCGRRGVTPHHLRFRSAGGDDAAENLTSLCVWCHLEGIHGGRLKAAPPASDLRWTLGRTGHTVVQGRRRERATD